MQAKRIRSQSTNSAALKNIEQNKKIAALSTVPNEQLRRFHSHAAVGRTRTHGSVEATRIRGQFITAGYAALVDSVSITRFTRSETSNKRVVMPAAIVV